MRVMRSAAAALAALVGAFGAIGCLIAALFERDGFGRPRDSEPRTWYLLLLSAGLVACVAIPAWIGVGVWGRRAGIAVTCVALVLGALLFGVVR